MPHELKTAFPIVFTEMLTENGKQKLFKLFVVLILSWSGFSASGQEDKKAVFFGHNMTPTTDMMKPGTWTIGNYALAYTFPGTFFVATSPWIWTSYNAANLHLKWTHKIDEVSSFGFFVSYFQTYNSEPLIRVTKKTVVNSQVVLPPGTPDAIVVLERYQWESTSIHSLYGYNFSPQTKTYLSFRYSYFWNEDYPYSIRMDPGDDSTPAQIDLTSLTLCKLGDSHYYWGFEGGSIGLNYHAPYLHIGSSLSYLTDSWLILAGASYTSQFKEVFQSSAWTPGRYDDRLHISKTTGDPYYARYLLTALHPELQIQYYF